jgi:sugar phosphate isomerase/epimerase
VGYWHDTGHADIKQSMGLLDHRAHLAQNAARLIGFHLHDVNDQGQDHQAIGQGRIDFKMISEFWQPEHALVLELSPRVSPEAVLRSRQYLETLLAERFG